MTDEEKFEFITNMLYRLRTTKCPDTTRCYSCRQTDEQLWACSKAQAEYVMYLLKTPEAEWEYDHSEGSWTCNNCETPLSSYDIFWSSEIIPCLEHCPKCGAIMKNSKIRRNEK